jgi:hypothetical protein
MNTNIYVSYSKATIPSFNFTLSNKKQVPNLKKIEVKNLNQKKDAPK